MLWDGGESLVEQILQIEVVRADQELVPPKIRPPMANGHEEPDELAFVNHELDVGWHNLATQERHYPFVSVKNNVEVGP
jgi:hypothetical protein